MPTTTQIGPAMRTTLSTRVSTAAGSVDRALLHSSHQTSTAVARWPDGIGLPGRGVQQIDGRGGAPDAVLDRVDDDRQRHQRDRVAHRGSTERARQHR